MGGNGPAGTREEHQRSTRLITGRFEALFRSPAVGIIELGVDGAFLAVNDTYCQLTGYSRDELSGMRIFDLSWPEDREQHRAALEPFMRRQTPYYRLTKRYRRKDGSEVWVDVSGMLCCGEAEEIDRTINIVQDVSERHRAETVLRQVRERLEIAIEAAGSGIYDWDVLANRIRLDERVRAWWGIASDDPITLEAFLSAVHPEDRESARASIDAALDPAGSHRFDIELRVIHATDGQERWVAAVGRTSVCEQRAVRVVGVIRDITARKSAEVALWEREESFRALVEPFAAAIWEATAEGKALSDSRTWRVHTGQTLEEWMQDAWYTAVHPDDRGDAIRVWQEAVRSGQPISNTLRLRNQSAQWRWTQARAAPLRNADGSVRKWIGMYVDVHDRVTAEHELRESEAKYRALFESMDEGFVLGDVQFDGDKAVDILFVAANPPAVRMLHQDVTGVRLSAMSPSPGFGQEWLDSLGRVARTAEPVRVDHDAKSLATWFECHAFKVGQSDQTRIGVVFEDVTERRRAEERERKAAASDAFRVELSDALRRLTDPVQIQTAAATILGRHLNVARVAYKQSEDGHLIPQAQYVEGVPASSERCYLPAFGGRAYSELHSGHTVVVSDIEEAPLTEAERAAYRAEAIRAHLTVPVMKDGRLLAILSLQHPVPRLWTEEDRTLVEEVAERTWDAGERARVERALREKDRRLHAALSAAHMGTWHWDVRHDIQAADENLQQLMGISPDRACVPMEQFLGAIAPEDRAGVRSAFARSAEQGASFDVDFRVPCDGDVRWLKDKGEVVCDPDGRPLYVTGACMDITDRKRMEEELRVAARRKDEFLAMLSHELRNPLAPIRNSVYILERADPGGEQAVRARQIIDRQARHLTRLIEDLLDITRIGRGKISLQRERVDLNELAKRTSDDHRPLFFHNGIELVVVDAGGPLYADADPTRVTQMVGNLLGNSAKFTPAGGRTTLVIERDGQGSARICVRDNGLGISPETLAHLFEPFVQAERTMARSTGGLGLGLALVKGLAELHGGKVEAHSKGLGKGAELTIVLPLAGSTSTPQPVWAQTKPSARVRVLVVEDNVDAAQSLREVLELGGHEVAIAYNGYDGLAQARRFRPHVVFCDLGLPGMDGLTLARAMRADRDLRTIALVAVSGYAQPEDIDKTKEAGFDAHLSKPPTLTALERALAAAVHPDGNRA